MDPLKTNLHFLSFLKISLKPGMLKNSIKFNKIILSILCTFSLQFVSATTNNEKKTTLKADNCYSDKAKLTFKGEHKTKKGGKVVINECFFCVTEYGYTNEEGKQEQFAAEVLTSFNHGHDKPEPIIVKVVPKSPDKLSGKQKIGDEIVVFLDPKKRKSPIEGEPDFPEIANLYTAYAVNHKWKHGTHSHTDRCENLKLQKEEVVK